MPFEFIFLVRVLAVSGIAVLLMAEGTHAIMILLVLTGVFFMPLSLLYHSFQSKK